MASMNVLVECLTATLSADPNARVAAELKLAEYLASQARLDTAVLLSQLVLAQGVDMSLRQMSIRSIVLRKYVKERWSPYFSTFKGSPASPEAKTTIRAAVFSGLSDPNRKIRSLSAHTLASIANSDWPDEYPDLLSSLISLLSSGSPNSVHGAMQVFTEFIKEDLTEDQILPVLRQLLPVLLTVLGSTEQHTPLTRARTVSVFNQCVSALYMVKSQHPQAVNEATANVLPVWLEAFKTLLGIDPTKDINAAQWDGLQIRIEIFKTLDIIHTSFPRTLTPYLQGLLSAALHHLHVVYPAFVKYYLSATEATPTTSEDNTIELPQLICPIFDFVSSIARGGKAREWFTDDNSLALATAICNFSQMSDDDEETWTSNANAFVAQEGDETQAYSVRIAGFDLLGTLVERSPARTAATCDAMIRQIIQSSNQAKENGVDDWWRPLEASLAAIGSQADTILECIEDEQDAGRVRPVDIESLLTNVIPNILRLSELPFLQGRAFVFASQYSKLLPAELTGQYLEAALQVVEATEAGIPVKVSAVKAIFNFCSRTDDAALVPLGPRMIKDLGPFLLATTEDTLSLVLETVSTVVDIAEGEWMDISLSESLITALLEVWAKNNKDPIFLSMFSDIFENVAKSPSPGVYPVVVKRALPALCQAIDHAKPDDSWITSSAIELATSLVRGSKDGQLGDGFFALLAPSLFRALSTAEDRDVLQNGITCLTMVVRKDCNQLLSWNDSQTGRSGLENVLTLIAKLLHSPDESGGLAIGDLIIHLLRRAGNAVLPVLPELLQAMIGRMKTAKTATFLQSLIVPFAFLIHNQLDAVISLLEGMNSEGRSGLDVLLQTWCENAETFQGFWPSRVSTVALTQLFTAASQRTSLQQIHVKGDIIVKPETKNVIMTRSRTKQTPHEFTSVPFPVKALKIILHDLQIGGESATVNPRGDVFEVESDDGDEEWTEEEKLNQGFTADEFAFLSEMIGPKGVAFDNDEILNDDGDEEFRDDPISTMDLQTHLIEFIRQCAAQNTCNFSVMVDQLTPEEALVIQNVFNKV
ncbi:ARM repeat-containing protein [Fistulina hepatica ATCC 64428]|uniref:ARM repeat-containing protein n=1 Tax=Fistulina hepatica ATCC 64428 TaxID=1128425 RepID=A0A0D7AGD4_9AGAR|nr:ARM repeat-containing protein [Fistulina hepatica ATCC 64428]